MDGFKKISRLGFVRDAENLPAQSAFDSICGLLKKFSLPAPAALGHIAEDAKRRIAIFIMPNNAGAGMLEQLCLKTVAATPIYACVNTFVECIRPYQSDEELGKFNEPKARVQMYLATRAPLVKSLGLAALKGLWDVNHSDFNNVKQFLQTLFA